MVVRNLQGGDASNITIIIAALRLEELVTLSEPAQLIIIIQVLRWHLLWLFIWLSFKLFLYVLLIYLVNNNLFFVLVYQTIHLYLLINNIDIINISTDRL